MISNVIRAIKKSIAHWEKMRKWAVEQEGAVDSYLMFKSMGTSWGASSCPLCHMFNRTLFGDLSCKDCPLRKCEPYNDHVCVKAWQDVDQSTTWKEWVSNADRLIGLLHQALKDYEEKREKEDENHERIFR